MTENLCYNEYGGVEVYTRNMRAQIKIPGDYMDRIKVVKLGKSFGIREIFKDVSFEIKKRDRIGLVGPNGGGKSTLLKCLLGMEEADEGSVILSEGATIGYLRQETNLGDLTLREEIHKAWSDVKRLEEKLEDLSLRMEQNSCDEGELKELAALQERMEWLGGYDYESQSRRIIYGLGFTDNDMDKRASDFSGGQKTRINLAKALVRQPDFLFLDEPTNHLDMEMLEWLENYLAAYPGGILVVSHDRYFLDRIATGIIELEKGRVNIYRGSYSRYMEQKKAQHKAYEKAFKKQQEYIKATEAYIDKYRAGIKSKMARGRQLQLNRLERLEAPMNPERWDFTFPRPKDCADKVLQVRDLEMAYGENSLFSQLSFMIRKGESVALIGPNGAGKSTLVKIIRGEISPLDGDIRIGNRVQMGYFSQEHEELHPQWSALEEIINNYNIKEEEARNVLGRFLFREDAVFRLVREMSGGEKARLALLKLFLEGNNFLILDEPTNHLDIPTREIVEEALLAFKGTYLVISHDRYFLDKIAERTFRLDDGLLTEYMGNYSYYREKEKEKADLRELAKQKEGLFLAGSRRTPSQEKYVLPMAEAIHKEEKRGRKEPLKDEGSGKEEFLKGKTKKINAFMQEKQLALIEQDIARLEATVKMYGIELSMAQEKADYRTYEEKAQLLAETEKELENAYSVWESLMEE